eukprot:1138409-Pelagomonas_calceolata.AAC.1
MPCFVTPCETSQLLMDPPQKASPQAHCSQHAPAAAISFTQLYLADTEFYQRTTPPYAPAAAVPCPPALTVPSTKQVHQHQHTIPLHTPAAAVLRRPVPWPAPLWQVPAPACPPLASAALAAGTGNHAQHQRLHHRPPAPAALPPPPEGLQYRQPSPLPL